MMALRPAGRRTFDYLVQVEAEIQRFDSKGPKWATLSHPAHKRCRGTR